MIEWIIFPLSTYFGEHFASNKCPIFAALIKQIEVTVAVGVRYPDDRWMACVREKRRLIGHSLYLSTLGLMNKTDDIRVINDNQPKKNTISDQGPHLKTFSRIRE